MKEKMNIRLFKPSLGKEHWKKLMKYFLIHGLALPKVNEFEKRWAIMSMQRLQ